MPSSGERDEEPESCDDDTGCTPSYSESCVMHGLSREEKNKEILLVPLYEGVNCTDGIWEHSTRGHGESDENDEEDANNIPANGHTGHFGVFAGNWGGKWKKESEDDYMNNDIWSSVCQVILLQEVEPLFWHKMKLRQLEDGASRPLFLGVKGDEGKTGNSLLIAGRPGIVLGCRLKVFHRTVDGPYREKKKDKWATSRIMVAELKMKNFRIRGSGGSVSDILPVANVHMHSRTAKKETKNGHEVTKGFWDLLAGYILQNGVRLMAGDFNMSFLCVIAEMRARGFQINLAAWYPFYMTVQEEMMVDSCGMFVIGPWQGVRLIYDCSLFEIDAPYRTNNNSMVMEHFTNEAGKECARRYEAQQYTIANTEKVQGYPLKSYMPKNKTKEELMRWTFDCVADKESAVAEQKAAMKKMPHMYPAPDFNFGAASWNWPQMAICSQKLVRQDKFDPEEFGYFARGAHMPLMLFIGEKNKTRRSWDSRVRRQANEAARGWGRARIEAQKYQLKDQHRPTGASSSSGTSKPQQWVDMPQTITSYASSSSSNPSAWQDKRVWNTGWSSNDNWGWKQ